MFKLFKRKPPKTLGDGLRRVKHHFYGLGFDVVGEIGERTYRTIFGNTVRIHSDKRRLYVEKELSPSNVMYSAKMYNNALASTTKEYPTHPGNSRIATERFRVQKGQYPSTYPVVLM